MENGCYVPVRVYWIKSMNEMSFSNEDVNGNEDARKKISLKNINNLLKQIGVIALPPLTSSYMRQWLTC